MSRTPGTTAAAATYSSLPPADAPARQWRCHACNALLGIVRGTELHVKYKEAHHWITGRIRHACRRCGAANGILVGVTPTAPASMKR